MRVLWFTNTSCGYKSQKVSGGGWMTALLNEITKEPSIQLGISFCHDDKPNKAIQGNTTYYPIPNYRKPLKDKFLDVIKHNDFTRDEISWPYYISHFKKIINDFKPDVIEVFGSELYIGLATITAKELNIPCCLHVQGILSLYINIFLTPGMSRHTYICKNGIKSIYSNFQYLTYWNRSCHREKTILRAVPHIIGRTDWDRQAMEILAPQAQYHYGGEILRPEFYAPAERTLSSKVTITTTISKPTYKGFDLLLKTANILKNEIGLDFIWNVYGNIDPRLAEHLAGIKHKEVNVNLKGVATAHELREALLSSTLYCHTSYIENSPNSIAEAQILGIPVVATNVGGTASMVKDGETGFLFPSTDPYMAAYFIKKLALDKGLNTNVGNRAKEIAEIRHDKNTIIKQLINVYHTLLQ